MPIQDLPDIYEMDPALAGVAEEVAMARAEDMRLLLGRSMLLNERPNLNDVWSVAAEVLAAQLNIVAYALQERSREMRPKLANAMGHADYVGVLLADVQLRALTRNLQGKDKSE